MEAFFQSWSNLTQFLETEKYDAKPTYKKFLGYRPGVYVIGDILSMSRTAMATQMCAFVRQRLTRESKGIRVNRFRADCGSCSKVIRTNGDLDLWEGEYTYRCILINDYDSSTRDIVEFYNKRGGKERIFDNMNNGLVMLPSFLALGIVQTSLSSALA